jgi:hypothetical protein
MAHSENLITKSRRNENTRRRQGFGGQANKRNVLDADLQDYQDINNIKREGKDCLT